jgi:uncharacterized protein (TIGR02996 family)
MHPDEAAFLADIAAAPLDDAPKLVFADWLDEHGRAVEAIELRAEVRARHFLGAWSPPVPHERDPFPTRFTWEDA